MVHTTVEKVGEKILESRPAGGIQETFWVVEKGSTLVVIDEKKSTRGNRKGVNHGRTAKEKEGDTTDPRQIPLFGGSN